MLSGTLAAGALALALALFGDWFWALTSAAAAPPMPALPRIMVQPTAWLTWPHQDILVFQPLLAGCHDFDALSSVVPLLSRALADEPAAFELAVSAADGAADEHVSLLAGDAGTVRLGEAAGPTADPR